MVEREGKSVYPALLRLCNEFVALPLTEDQRLGQYFCNTYIKQPWPELYYEEDGETAFDMIAEWLQDNQYYDKLPEKVNR